MTVMTAAVYHIVDPAGTDNTPGVIVFKIDEGDYIWIPSDDDDTGVRRCLGKTSKSSVRSCIRINLLFVAFRAIYLLLTKR